MNFEPAALVSRKLTWYLKMMIFKRNLFFLGSIGRFHVKFQECASGQKNAATAV